MVYDPRQDERYKGDKLFLSLLKQESRFNPNAVSPTGARGYAQILPSTARDPGFGLTPNIAAISDPKQNVEFGYNYFNAMKKRYGGDESAALVAYNGGPGAADRWVKSGKNDKVISAESRNYYKTIQADAGSTAKVKPIVENDDYEEQSSKVMHKVNSKKSSSRLSDEDKPAVKVEPEEKKTSALEKPEEETEEKTTPKLRATSSDDSESSSTVDDGDYDYSGVKRDVSLRPFTAPERPQLVPVRLQAPKSVLLDDPRMR